MNWFKRDVADLDTRVARALFDRSPDAILLMSGGQYVACNAAAETIYERPRSEILGHSPSRFSAPIQGDGRRAEDHVPERAQQALRDGFARFEWLNMRPNGEARRCIVMLIPHPVERPDDLLVITQQLDETSQVVDSLRDGLRKVAGGDLTYRIETPFRSDYEPLRASFNDTAAMLQNSMREIDAASQRVRNGAAEIRHAADDLSMRTEQQAASIEETAAAVQQINVTAQQSAVSGAKAADVAASAQTNAAESGVVVQRAIDAMGGIERTSNEISDIIAVIDGIAFQTNLLALNAGVEAARAGDAGKGFAVVASEVRALAQRSADAAKDVKSRIGASADQVRAGVEHVHAAGSALDRIAAQVREMSGLIADIAGSAQQQATGFSQINLAIGDMDSMTQQNAAMVEETTAAARQLALEANGMAETVGRFDHGAGHAATITDDWTPARRIAA
ncbi:methyl-accepting chemotaxis protein [Sphingomonas sp. NPDC019816]|uniref:methyl-accepting chemotaxis protein n=1 Tax=unclassified Sphingomonas TaxID=196159 RepID=UPI00289E8258|nr:methyl-accepting chemotaxis protein [Sphingomonas sp.]